MPPTSLIHGPSQPALWHKTLSTVIDEQEARYGDRTAAIIPWQSVRLTYRDLAARSRIVANAVLGMGLTRGDHVGIMAGNCYEYLEVFLGCGRIGCPVIVLNNTYTPMELQNAAQRSSCKLVFISLKIGRNNLAKHVETLRGNQPTNTTIPELRRIVVLDLNASAPAGGVETQHYAAFVSSNELIVENTSSLNAVEELVSPQDVLNLQFTSGTTGSPKAAMLSHVNIINNARFVGHAMRLTPSDVVCCPPPLFHCFGLVMGFLASFCYGSAIVFPSDAFDADRVVEAMIRESATVIIGVPTMYLAELDAISRMKSRPRNLRTGLASGSSVSQALMDRLRAEMGVDKMLIAYGMTETSPVTFITSLEDGDDKGTSTVGKPLPHTAAKVVSPEGKTLGRGKRGELCTSGFGLQKGYWRNEEKTREVMRPDMDGNLWMHTGDEAVIDKDGYAKITGRIKDIIIRGGENIFPREIEELLMAHPSIVEASVVGVKDEKYGEVVGCFLKRAERASKLEDQAVRSHVLDHLGRHKAPQHIFWIGDAGVGTDFPKTGSGKHQKHILRDIGNRLVRQGEAWAKL
ncbi:acetyl-CoA synthetase-like protein [Aspergillus pseudoustus]|uniref:Acetyl-CoA synthetase-like protein n=1 Tax=Aspergillus pseudoustus TaxID=1810923 RepID=A0ABR4K9B6_9EURO